MHIKKVYQNACYIPILGMGRTILGKGRTKALNIPWTSLLAQGWSGLSEGLTETDSGGACCMLHAQWSVQLDLMQAG